MNRKRYHPREESSRSRSYREWFEQTYLLPAQKVKERSPTSYTLLLLLAGMVFLFVCSIPCLIVARLAYRLVMGV